MTITRETWVSHHWILDHLDYSALPDLLIPYVFDNLGEIQPVVDSVQQSQVEYVRKHAARDDEGELVILEAAGADTVSTADGHVQLEDPEAYRRAMEQMMTEEVELDIRTINVVDLAQALRGTDVRLSELRRALGWMITS